MAPSPQYAALATALRLHAQRFRPTVSRTAVVVQARVGSTRLPGKVLQTLGGKTVLAHGLARCAAIPGIDAVVCATSDLPQDDPIVAEARAVGAEVFRG